VKTITDILETYQNGDCISICLLLTEQCNFQCRHCFYSAGPNKPPKYIADTVLTKVQAMLSALKHDYEIDNINVNLIGGEPTLNLDKFEHVFKTVSRWTSNGLCQLEMTTNGWWLHKLSAAKRFMEIMAQHAPGWGLDEGFTVRISNDQYHDEFRPHGETSKHLEQILYGLWEPWEWNGESPFFETRYECPKCYEKFDEYHDGCPKCDCDYLENLEIETFNWSIPPAPQHQGEGEAWIYVENQKYHSGPHSVTPIGRGAEFGANDIGKKFKSCGGNTLTFTPNGKLTDVCCRGSNLGIGTADDDPIVLLAMAQNFFERQRPTCYSCHKEAETWIRNGAQELMTKLYKELEGVNG